ncbi:hypothetical protein D3C71_1882170 [compost metagenome]
MLRQSVKCTDPETAPSHSTHIPAARSLPDRLYVQAGYLVDRTDTGTGPFFRSK